MGAHIWAAQGEMEGIQENSDLESIASVHSFDAAVWNFTVCWLAICADFWAEQFVAIGLLTASVCLGTKDTQWIKEKIFFSTHNTSDINCLGSPYQASD